MRPDLDLLSDRTRRHLLALLHLERELCVCELVAALRVGRVTPRGAPGVLPPRPDT